MGVGKLTEEHGGGKKRGEGSEMWRSKIFEFEIKGLEIDIIGKLRCK